MQNAKTTSGRKPLSIRQPLSKPSSEVTGFVIVLFDHSVAQDIHAQRPVFFCTKKAAERAAEKDLPRWVPAYAVCPATIRDKEDGGFEIRVDDRGANWKEVP